MMVADQPIFILIEGREHPGQIVQTFPESGRVLIALRDGTEVLALPDQVRPDPSTLQGWEDQD